MQERSVWQPRGKFCCWTKTPAEEAWKHVNYTKKGTIMALQSKLEGSLRKTPYT